MRTFDVIECFVPCDIVYGQEDDCCVSVNADKEQLDAIAIYVKHGCLRVAPKYDNFILRSIQKMLHDGKGTNHDGVSIHVTSPEIKKISMVDSSSFTAPDKVDANHLDIILDGSGNIVINNLIAEDVKSRCLGSGTVIIKGEATHHYETIVGSGTIDVSGLQTRLSKSQ